MNSILQPLLSVGTILLSFGGTLIGLYLMETIYRFFIRPKNFNLQQANTPTIALRSFVCPCCEADVEEVLKKANDKFQPMVAFQCPKCHSLQRWNTSSSQYVIEDYQQESTPQYALRNPDKRNEFEELREKRKEEILALLEERIASETK